MTNFTGWIIGGGLATLITAVTGLISALHAHQRITGMKQQQGSQGNAPGTTPPAA